MERDTIDRTHGLGDISLKNSVKDMKIDGIDMSIVYPSTGLLLYSIPDGDLLTHIFKIYERLGGRVLQRVPQRCSRRLRMVNVDDVDEGIKELERCAKLGFVGAMTSVYPPEERPYSLADLRTLCGLRPKTCRMPLSLHIAHKPSGSRPGVPESPLRYPVVLEQRRPLGTGVHRTNDIHRCIRTLSESYR